MLVSIQMLNWEELKNKSPLRKRRMKVSIMKQ